MQIAALAVLRETARLLAVKLADTWLLFNNSQIPRNHMETSRKSSCKIQHNSQQIFFVRNSQ